MLKFLQKKKKEVKYQNMGHWRNYHQEHYGHERHKTLQVLNLQNLIQEKAIGEFE